MAAYDCAQPVYDLYSHLQQPLPLPMAAFDRNGINTLFVSGLPDDVKAREIHNLFRRRPGFDFCQLKYTGRGNQVVAFATFFNQQAAMAAMHSLNGVKFDPQTGSTLHIELARSNSRRKHKPGNGVYVVIDERTKQGRNAQENYSDDGDSSDSDEDQEPGNVDYVEEEAGDPESTANEDQPEKRTRDGASPCSTLFIANLGPNCTEEELNQALVQYPGFNILKMRDKGGMPVAFADFEEIEQATNVMEDLQGATLPSSDRGGMHIEFRDEGRVVKLPLYCIVQVCPIENEESLAEEPKKR